MVPLSYLDRLLSRNIMCITTVILLAVSHHPVCAETLFLCGENQFSNVESEGCKPIEPPRIAPQRNIRGDTGVVPLRDVPLGLPSQKSTAKQYAPLVTNNHTSNNSTTSTIEQALASVSECLSSFSIEGTGSNNGCSRLQNLDNLFK